VHGILEHVVLAVAAGRLVGLGEFLLAAGSTLSSSAPCMISSGTSDTASRRSRISCGLASWIVSHGLKKVLLFVIMLSRFFSTAF
jgi:hypothetical protein